MATSHFKSYLGAAGELRAASELSLRGYVAHIPAVDEGADLWAVNHSTGQGLRVQVKATAIPDFSKLPGHIAYQISVDTTLLKSSNVHIVIYLVVWGKWRSFVLTGAQLQSLRGNATQSNVLLVLHPNDDVTVGGVKGNSILPYEDAWDTAFQPVPGKSVLEFAT